MQPTTKILTLSLHDALPIFSEWLLDEYRGEREKEEARISRWLQVERRASEVTASIPGSVDRKSTRLNSSHSQISYAVFCLKKKNTNYMAVVFYVAKYVN